MYRTVQLVAVGVVAVILTLSALSGRFPGVAWLRPFRFERPSLTEEQKATVRRRSNMHAGVELILLGLIIPMGYAALTAMFFSEFTTRETTVVAASSVLCIGLGVTALWRNRR